MNYDTIPLSDVCIGNGRYGIAASAVEYSSELPTYLRITDINDDGTLNRDGLKSVDNPKSSKYYLSPNDIVFARTGASTGRNYFYDGSDGKLVYAGFLIKFSIDPKNINPLFIKYYCRSKNYYDWVKSINTGSTRGNINAKTLEDMPIPILPREQQDLIAAVLSALDDKIELNNRINKNLEAQAQAIFKSWFVNFEPFRDGEFMDSELGPIPKGWVVGTLGDVIEIHDSKRIPLSSRERDKMEKRYPYYGAAALMDYVDSFIFDGIYILLGEDGTVMTDDGHPVLQYVWGQFWVNNHAHILKGANGFTEESLYILLKSINISGIVTGAVQPKISQANLKSIQLVIPPTKIIDYFNQILNPIFSYYRTLSEQSRALTALRDTLLPKLMSGEIRVPLEV